MSDMPIGLLLDYEDLIQQLESYYRLPSNTGNQQTTVQSPTEQQQYTTTTSFVSYQFIPEYTFASTHGNNRSTSVSVPSHQIVAIDINTSKPVKVVIGENEFGTMYINKDDGRVKRRTEDSRKIVLHKCYW